MVVIVRGGIIMSRDHHVFGARVPYGFSTSAGPLLTVLLFFLPLLSTVAEATAITPADIEQLFKNKQFIQVLPVLETWKDAPPEGDADDTGDKKYPICFTRNTMMKVSVKWRIEPSDFGITVIMQGDGPGNLDFPETTATVSGNDLTIMDVECSNPFDNKMDFFDPMSIAWGFSVDGGSTWWNAGICANQTYVTLGDPLTTVFHTLAHLGCKNANGENTAANCTSKIWSEFTDRDVRRVDGVQLTYYASYTCVNVTTASLLANGDGQCGSWAKFFIDMRKVQGIDDTDEYVIFEPIADDGFCVKNWTFTGAGSSGHATHPYLNLPDFPLVGATSYNWKFAEVVDATGIPGQGNANPASLFNNHQVVISGQYYDPSYGVQHIYCTSELREEIFTILKDSIGCSLNGRPGMELWHILTAP